ncbi:hypothetical protein BGW37DRAFT_491638 [Umbelopsis sp. PMI_123]|nr:hypothetical protein BGW37DRAFT_491638 [Umbelopsis sp. PMI_123]
MEQKNDTPDMPMPCIAGCGFYGNPIYNNMCSKCFKDKSQSQKKDTPIHSSQSSPAVAPQPTKDEPQPQPVAHNTPIVSSEVEASETSSDLPKDDTPSKPVQENKGRCFKCRIKVPLAKQTTNKCKCDYIFCDAHRYPDRHECSFDHAKKDKDILAKNNPKLNERPKGGRSFHRIDSL